MIRSLTEENPLIRINWYRIRKRIKIIAVGIIWIIKKIIEKIIKAILEILILLMRGFLWTHKQILRIIKAIFFALKKFSKKDIKGIWILLLILIFLIISNLALFKGWQMIRAMNKQLDEVKTILNNQQGSNLKLFKENEQLKEEIKVKNKKLQSKAEEKARFTRQQWILANRNRAEQKLPEKVKNIITEQASIYGVKDTRLVECIVLHESGGRDEAIGDDGGAVGVAQYHLATFLGHRRQMGLSQVDLRRDTKASLQAMLFNISRGGIDNWTTRTKCI